MLFIQFCFSKHCLCSLFWYDRWPCFCYYIEWWKYRWHHEYGSLELRPGGINYGSQKLMRNEKCEEGFKKLLKNLLRPVDWKICYVCDDSQFVDENLLLTFIHELLELQNYRNWLIFLELFWFHREDFNFNFALCFVHKSWEVTHS